MPKQPFMLVHDANGTPILIRLDQIITVDLPANDLMLTLKNDRSIVVSGNEMGLIEAFP